MTRFSTYSPLVQPVLVSQERMQEILQKRRKPDIQLNQGGSVSRSDGNNRCIPTEDTVARTQNPPKEAQALPQSVESASPQAACSSKLYSWQQLDREMWMARKLKDHGANIFDGLTTSEQRKIRFREAIKTLGLEMVIAGNRGGKPVTYTELFATVFGEPL